MGILMGTVSFLVIASSFPYGSLGQRINHSVAHRHLFRQPGETEKAFHLANLAHRARYKA
jgi:hypothetical protein